MKMTEAQLILLEKILEERGYKKYIPNDLNGYDVSRICKNESFYWYKTLEKVREEDEDGDYRTTFGAVLYIPVWDHYQYLEPHETTSRYGAEVVVQILDNKFYSQFFFPFVQEKDNSLFHQFIPKDEFNGKWVSKIVTEKDINALVDTLEELTKECGEFYKSKCMKLIYKDFSNG